MKLKIIQTNEAPEAVGPYSQAVRVGDLLYTAGQIAIDPAIGKLIDGDVAAQTEQLLKNLTAVLTAADSSLNQVIKTTIFLRYMKDYQIVNQIYAQYFIDHKPARSTVAVSALPLGALVEIELVALCATAEKKKKKSKKKNKNKK